MRIPTKRLLALALAITVILCAAPFASANGEPRYYDWKQYDSRWGSVVLTNKTMKQVGCLATAVAMLAVRAGLRNEKGFDPGVFAAEMKKAGGFNADNDLLWEVLPKAVPGLAAQTPWESLNGTQAEKTAKLKDYLDKGCQVAVAVRNGGHWVALRSVTGGKAVMMDPGSTATDLFGAYSAAGVTRVALLRADRPKPQTTQPRTTHPRTMQPAAPKEDISMAESIFAFAKDLGGLFLAIGRYLLTMWKV